MREKIFKEGTIKQGTTITIKQGTTIKIRGIKKQT